MTTTLIILVILIALYLAYRAIKKDYEDSKPSDYYTYWDSNFNNDDHYL